MPLNIFISYSHRDVQYSDDLQRFLVNLIRDNKIVIWVDNKLGPGTNWNEEITNKLSQSDIIILIVTQNLIASEYINNDEIQKAIMQKKTILPILAEDCDWLNWRILNELHGTITMASMQFLPTETHDGEYKLTPLNEWTHPEKAWTKISQKIRQEVERKLEKLTIEGPMNQNRTEIEYENNKFTNISKVDIYKFGIEVYQLTFLTEASRSLITEASYLPYLSRMPENNSNIKGKAMLLKLIPHLNENDLQTFYEVQILDRVLSSIFNLGVEYSRLCVMNEFPLMIKNNYIKEIFLSINHFKNILLQLNINITEYELSVDNYLLDNSKLKLELINSKLIQLFN